MTDALFTYVLRLADDAAILGQRLGEWCGHAPTLEEDIGLANVALDHVGQARALYSYAAEVEGKGRDEDQLCFLRVERAFRNCLLVEQPNGDFAQTIARQLFFSAFMLPFWEKLTGSSDATLSAIAAKAEKEAAYHLRHASEWTIRLGDGTAESHRRMQEAIDLLWPYTGELFEADDTVSELVAAGIAVDPQGLRAGWLATLSRVLEEATLTLPAQGWMQTGGRDGRHSESFGHLLSEMQYMQRAYPGHTW
ncbi:phenylacetate-CoA oxygenase subunit PaaC [Stappia taiwanensis]|uniref:Phenylacetate-CoA oxygenase subunit PaaC n=1 Tax=Stappia taiwanensis TaxID=992267 RepID=A0A838XSR2_9HYPH|nr:1,2-phenylacetyl-CoA epoxidase subunit PaaC [Stappia taiwanensis]MBA4611698.1 phenylacetate-CoA oxygenase subunit PaaC [Stappia taiwanensis]GGE97485.1 phenylacetic acid degradation protein [Stappia taiwanensis]